MELHYLDIHSITYDEPTGKIELALNPDAKSKGDTEPYVLYATNCKGFILEKRIFFILLMPSRNCESNSILLP